MTKKKRGPVEPDKWMSRLDSAQIIPNVNSRPLIILGDIHTTYLPNRVGPLTKDSLWPIVLAFVNSDHWVAVEFQEVEGQILFPPYITGWNKPKITLPEALRWGEELQASFDLWNRLQDEEFSSNVP